MKIYNESKTEILTEVDYELGHLEPDKIVVAHHDAVPATPEVTVKEIADKIVADGGAVTEIRGKWYEILQKYDFGMDVKLIEPIPAVPAKEAYDEYENIYVFVPYTKEELAEINREKIRARRVTECFAVVNRGKLWYDRLSEEQETELADWYEAWLNAPETLVVPDRPEWIDNKLNTEEV